VEPAAAICPDGLKFRTLSFGHDLLLPRPGSVPDRFVNISHPPRDAKRVKKVLTGGKKYYKLTSGFQRKVEEPDAG
jgi:hypothetical protein